MDQHNFHGQYGLPPYERSMPVAPPSGNAYVQPPNQFHNWEPQPVVNSRPPSPEGWRYQEEQPIVRLDSPPPVIVPEVEVSSEVSSEESDNESKPEFYPSMTISDDRSGKRGQDLNLLALKERNNPLPEPSQGSRAQCQPKSKPPPPIHKIPPQHVIPGGHNPNSNPAREDYNMQLMLLEQQNKKRLLLARQKQDSMVPIYPQDPPKNDAEGLPYCTKDGLDESMKRCLRNLSHGGPNADIQLLENGIRQLQNRVQQLQGLSTDPAPSRHQVLYRIMDHVNSSNYKGVYFDHPRWVLGDMNQSFLQADLQLDNLDLYLERNKDISFIVFKDFNPNGKADKLSSRPFKSASEVPQETTARPQQNDESVRPVAKDLTEALETLLGSSPVYKDVQHSFQFRSELKAPFLFMYHTRQTLSKLRESMSRTVNDQLTIFLNYLNANYGPLYEAVDELLSRNKILPEYMEYLFKPDDVVVSRSGDDLSGYVLQSWPTYDKVWPRPELGKPGNNTHNAQPSKNGFQHHWSMPSWFWEFNGEFGRRDDDIKIKLPGDETGEIDIAELNVFPIQFAPQNIVTKLQQRGQTFWKCRKRRFVSYTEKDQALERYMIDTETYKKLHPRSASMIMAEDSISVEDMEKDEPPDEKFQYLVPLTIKGYNLRRKQWFDLSVDRISDVLWNREAFQTLVIDYKTKDLIRALVSKQLAAERSTDLIAGKGNGLIMLLHGGPGTGKTLTAESVAEIAGKPLYRVTCGDIGTKAEEVEQYLESVLHLGKIWDCVVLLDEADVFLEQRSLRDLVRNALVSVFLRVLEYYEGILILTSNRVGTFDEAFKSRIQLALHYPALGPYQRMCIWENFFNRLESFGSVSSPNEGTSSSNSANNNNGAAAIDIADLRAHLNELKEERMNGRQIRNAITTARQYAEWKGTVLTYPLLKDVIEVSGRFDRYLDTLNGMEGDEIAAEEGLRVVEREETL